MEPKDPIEEDKTKTAPPVPEFKLTRNGVPVIPSRGETITLEQIQAIMDEEGV